MIAIDLVDFTDPMLKERDSAMRFISHPDDSGNFDFWSLWSAKEATFKLHRKRGNFKPKNIPIQFTSSNTFSSSGIIGTLIKSEDHLLTLISNQPFDYVIFDCETNAPSTEIRKKIKTWFYNNHQIETSVSSDQNGLPILSHNHSPISITHHERYLAFAYLIR